MMSRGGRRPNRLIGTKKYAPLVAYLAQSDAEEIVLTFDEIEALIGAPLSLAARIESAFWRTPQRAHVRALHDAGWEVHLDRRNRAIVFARRERAQEAEKGA